MNLIQSIETISPDLASVVADGWGCDVHPEMDKPGWVGDTEWAHIHFRPTLSRDKVAAIATLINNAPRMMQLLREVLFDGECYCTPRSEGGANGVCNFCQIKSLIGQSFSNYYSQ